MRSPLFPVMMRVPVAVETASPQERKRALSRLARTCVTASARCAGLVLEKMEKDLKGVPRPCGGVYWTLSHKPELVAGLAASHPVGIDVEVVKPVSAALFRRILDADEAIRFGRAPREVMFFKAFTAKEAVLKRHGLGIHHIGSVRVVSVPAPERLMLQLGDRRHAVALHVAGKRIMAVTGGDVPVHWQAVVDGDEGVARCRSLDGPAGESGGTGIRQTSVAAPGDR